jgi:Tfp pilus assembly protein PilN
MIRINLIPPEYIARINRKTVIAKAVLAGALVAAVISLASAWQFTREKTISFTLGKREAELRELQKDVDQVKAIEAQISEVQRYLGAIASINKGRLLYPRFMQDLIGDLPATMWFGSVGTTMAGASLNVTLPVTSRSAYDLAYWINYLETSGYYSGVTVGPIVVTESEEGKTFATSISFVYTSK